MRQMTLTQSGAPGHVIGSTFHWICLLFILLILVGVELLLYIVITLSWNAMTCFLESS